MAPGRRSLRGPSRLSTPGPQRRRQPGSSALRACQGSRSPCSPSLRLALVLSRHPGSAASHG
eukprot:2529272-Alexandrium_andersonii.AAC.1